MPSSRKYLVVPVPVPRADLTLAAVTGVVTENVVPLKVKPVPAVYVVLVFGGVCQVPSSRRYFAVPAVAPGSGTRPALWFVPDAPKFEYVVLLSGGVCQVPSSRKYLVVPAVAPGSGTRPALWFVPDAPKFVYVVFVGMTQVPSPRRNAVCLPAAGAGTRPAVPAAEAVAAVIFEYVVF